MKTLRLIALLLLVMTVVTSVSAQKDDKDKKPDLLTFTAGWSNSSFTGADADNLKNRNGFFAGVRKDFKIIPLLRLNTGILFTQQGTSYDSDQIDDAKLGYIDLPVGLKFMLGPVYATGGLSANFKITEDFGSLPKEFEPDIRAFDLDYSVGLGVKFLLFSLDLRWNNSFGDITKGDEELKNSYFLIGLGVSIPRN